MRPDDLLVIGAWIGTIGATFAMAWTPWRLTAGLHAVDLGDTAIGRAVSPLHVFVAPMLLLVAPLFVALAEARGLDGLTHPHVLARAALAALAAMAAVLAAQFVLRRSLLKVAAERRAAEAQARTVLASAGRRSARRPR